MVWKVCRSNNRNVTSTSPNIDTFDYRLFYVQLKTGIESVKLQIRAELIYTKVECIMNWFNYEKRITALIFLPFHCSKKQFKLNRLKWMKIRQ